MGARIYGGGRNILHYDFDLGLHRYRLESRVMIEGSAGKWLKVGRAFCVTEGPRQSTALGVAVNKCYSLFTLPFPRLYRTHTLLNT